MTHLRGGEYANTRLLMLDPATPFTFGTWVPFAWGRFVSLLESLGSVVLGAGVAVWVAALPIAALCGLGFFARTKSGDRAVSLSLGVAVLLQFGFVTVFNISDFHDHLIAVVVLLFPFGLAGVAALRTYSLVPEVRLPVLAGVLVLLVACAIGTNRAAAYPPERHLAGAWGERFLQQLPKGAVIVTALDSDLFYLWYVQLAKGERRDLFLYPANFYREPWVRRTMTPGDPRRDLVGFRPGPRGTVQDYVRDLARLVFGPLLASRSRVFTTMHQPPEIAEMHKLFLLREAARLVSDAEFKILMQAAERRGYDGAPVLLEVLPQRR